jgi:hypothetical protein
MEVTCCGLHLTIVMQCFNNNVLTAMRTTVTSSKLMDGCFRVLLLCSVLAVNYIRMF